MAYPDVSMTRPGQVENSGDAKALFLKKFSGEVLTTFDRLNVMRPLVRTRTISRGKSAQFPVLGIATTQIHTPGTNILAANQQQIKHDERVIFIDHKLVASTVIYDIDEAQASYDVRGPVATELARALAKTYDILCLHTAVLAARATPTITGLYGGSIVKDVNMRTSGAALAASLFEAAEYMDEKDVPPEGRVAIVSPEMYYNLIKDPSLYVLSTLATPNATEVGSITGPFGGAATLGDVTGTQTHVGIAAAGFPQLQYGNGSWSQGKAPMVAGIMVLKSNNVPSTRILSSDLFYGSDPGGLSENGNTYYGDFDETLGVVITRDAIGAVQLQGLGVEVEWKSEYQGWLTIAKMAVGIGILRPECAVELCLDEADNAATP